MAVLKSLEANARVLPHADFAECLFWIVVGGLVWSFWSWLTPSAPPRPAPPREPTQVVTFTGNVSAVKKVTRGSVFDHYEIDFSGASNGQDKLKLYRKVPEDDMRQLIGQKVTVTCLQVASLRNCHYLTRLEFDGREIATQEATSG